jgi:hypothetical protein
MNPVLVFFLQVNEYQAPAHLGLGAWAIPIIKTFEL